MVGIDVKPKQRKPKRFRFNRHAVLIALVFFVVGAGESIGDMFFKLIF